MFTISEKKSKLEILLFSTIFLNETSPLKSSYIVTLAYFLSDKLTLKTLHSCHHEYGSSIFDMTIT
ncbi:Uncharacterised protein [Vibrio cholerae]|nr:Uncharacterised protein [Vibrio cholerae]